MFNRARLGLPAAAAVVSFAVLAAACSSSPDPESSATTSGDEPVASASTASTGQTDAGVRSTPGGYDFDRSDPEAGVANIMAAFAADRDTAECIYEAWGDVANVAPADLTPDLMTFPICGTSIFQLMTGDPRFTGQEGG